MKEKYFKTLKSLSLEIDSLTDGEVSKMNGILYKAGDIVAVFNQQRMKYPNERKDLLLNETELSELRDVIDEIWDKAENINMVPRPKPDINVIDTPGPIENKHLKG